MPFIEKDGVVFGEINAEEQHRNINLNLQQLDNTMVNVLKEKERLTALKNELEALVPELANKEYVAVRTE